MKILATMKGLILNFLWSEKVEIKKIEQNVAEIKNVLGRFRAVVLPVISAALLIMEEQMYHSEPSDEWKKLQALREKIEEMERK